MNGPDHYRAAEACLESVDDDSEHSLALLAEAQVHATLALAAATALAEIYPQARAWEAAAGRAAN